MMHLKSFVNRATREFGFQLVRVTPPPRKEGKRYFNTGVRTPLDENSRAVYDGFYRDTDMLAEYYSNQDRLAFYSNVSSLLQRSEIQLDGKTILDVGCGTGHLLCELSTWSNPQQRFGCDFSAEAIKYSIAHFADIGFFVHDIYQFLPRAYDVITCTEVLEHLEYPHLALNNLLSSLMPEGVLVLTVPNGRYDNLIQHINFWSPESWRVFIERESIGYSLQTGELGELPYLYAIVRHILG